MRRAAANGCTKLHSVGLGREGKRPAPTVAIRGRRSRVVLLSIAVPIMGCGVKPVAPPPIDRAVALVGANLLDVVRGEIVPGMTVVVRGDRIERIFPAADSTPPTDARTIDATGKFLIPGLWDMHVHGS